MSPLAEQDEKPRPRRLISNLFSAVGASLLALMQRQLNFGKLREVCLSALRITAMVFAILIGASLFTLVFRGFGGDLLVEQLFHQLPRGTWFVVLVVMLVIFVLGLILDLLKSPSWWRPSLDRYSWPWAWTPSGWR